MKIALISYEFPPDTGFGGIGTYTVHLSEALARSGHQIEVFSCSHHQEQYGIRIQESILLHRVKAGNRLEFSHALVPLFAERQECTGFDLIETPEYGAEGLPLRIAFPRIPMMVTLHTPNFLVKQLNAYHRPVPLKKRIRSWLGMHPYQKEGDADYRLALSADAVCSPSQALARLLEKKWGLTAIRVLPSVFIPPPALVELPPAAAESEVITYIGRLDVRKGISQLAEAIPRVLKKHPGARFRFIGGDGLAPRNNGSMMAYLSRRLKRYLSRIECLGYVPIQDIPTYLRDTGIVVIPSLWENYPFVCLEAMSAGKAVVVSQNGGMKEMLGSWQERFLVDPFHPEALAQRLLWLLENPAERIRAGILNREKVCADTQKCIRDHLHSYAEMLSRCPSQKAGFKQD